jgi:hypothetical protein
MKRKRRKARNKSRSRKKQAKFARLGKNRRKQRRIKPRRAIRARNRQSIRDPRVARALGLMRREGVSASNAAHSEKMKLATFKNGAGPYLYRSGPGKPWKARSEDELRFSMIIITRLGPLAVIVPNSRERKLLHDYYFALWMFRASDDRAEAALKEFEGKTVGGHTLITDIKVLIELEEGGQFDRVENFYTPIGARS